MFSQVSVRPHLRGGGGGTPSQVRTGGEGTPFPGLDGVPPRQETEQHSEHLLRGVHVGGLSCITILLKNNENSLRW